MYVLVMHCTGIVEVQIPLKPRSFFWAYFATAQVTVHTTVKITFTSKDQNFSICVSYSLSLGWVLRKLRTKTYM